MAYEWNWTWINSADNTNSSSAAVTEGNSVVFSFRQPTRGPLGVNELNTAFGAVVQNIRRLWSQWRTYSFPVLNSLPAGSRDTRWGSPLREEIDCFSFGINGATLFVFNDADNSKADGRYWNSTESRPKTIAEVLEDIYELASAASSSTPGSLAYSVDLTPLWEAVGNRYKSVSLVSSSSSLDARAAVLEGHMSQLNEDIYGKQGVYTHEGFDTYHLGVPLLYSIAKYLDILLKIHDVPNGWHSDPIGMGHETLTDLLLGHTHPSTEVWATNPASTQDRTASSNLRDDIERIRWEINRTRGAADWQSDIMSPWMVAGYTSLSDHINYVGSGTPSATNPHGLNYVDVDVATYVDPIFDDIYTFLTGSTTQVSQPTYTSTFYIGVNDDVETAISALDTALDALAGSIVAGTLFDDGTGDHAIIHADADCTAAGDWSLALGNHADANQYGEVAQASGQVPAPYEGAALANGQTTVLTLYGTTIGDGNSDNLAPDTDHLSTIVVANDEVWAIKVTLLGRGSTSGGDTKVYHKTFDFTVANEAGENAVLVDQTETLITNTFGSDVVTAVAVQTDGTIDVSAETNGGEVAYWAARVETVQIAVVAPTDIT